MIRKSLNKQFSFIPRQIFREFFRLLRTRGFFSPGLGLASAILGLQFLMPGALHAVDHKLNFSNDNIPDVVTYDPSNNTFVYQNAIAGSTPTSVRMENAGIGDQGVVGDFDGDGITDFATFNREVGSYVVRASSSGTEVGIGIGGAGDFAYSANLDGDSCDDYVTFNPATGKYTFGYCASANVEREAQIIAPRPGLAPVIGDFDCDGTDDLGVFDRYTSRWTIQRKQYCFKFLLCLWPSGRYSNPCRL